MNPKKRFAITDTMQKIDATDPQAKSVDLIASNIAQLKALFPELVTEGPHGAFVDLDVLKALVGDATGDDADERYGLNWHGKSRARQLALTPSAATLRPCPQESVDWDTTQNLMIEGDNLEVLKLLQKSYAGKVKLIYIDPPYNTGKDFVYPDKFQDSIQNYLALTGQTEGGVKMSSNTDASGRFHTDWLNMVYPRLKLARNLLRDDGVIFISIADHEIHNLRTVMNEVFGEENFVATVIWQKVYSPKNSARHFSEDHDYVVVYAKNAEGWTPRLLPRTEEMEARYGNTDNDPRGPWKAGDLSARNYYGEGTYPITCPSGRQLSGPPPGTYWRVSKAKFDELDADKRIWWGVDGSNVPAIKRFLSEVKDGRVPQTLWTYDEVGHTQEAKKELIAAVDFPNSDVVFGTPKPTRLLRRILQLATTPDTADIVVDFFAGTGTTMDAVFQQNTEDGGNRRCVLVQLPEPLSGAEVIGWTSIADITKARLRGAGEKQRAASSEQRAASSEQRAASSEQRAASSEQRAASRTGAVAKSSSVSQRYLPDVGFRVFKLDTSNIRLWSPKQSNLADDLLASQDHLVEGRSEADILYELLLKLGLDLCVPIERREIVGKAVHAVGSGVLLACFAPVVERFDVDALAQGIVGWLQELTPAGNTTCVFRDSAFDDDVVKTNLAAILQQHGIQNVRSL